MSVVSDIRAFRSRTVKEESSSSVRVAPPATLLLHGREDRAAGQWLRVASLLTAGVAELTCGCAFDVTLKWAGSGAFRGGG